MILTRFRVKLGVLAILGCVALPAIAMAESLTEALVTAYESNPTLRAQRSDLRATDENVPQALSGWRPVITQQTTYGRTWTKSSTNPKNHQTPLTMTIELQQPVFRGFKTINSTKSAEAGVKAARENLLSVEQEVLYNTVSAYMTVIRDRQIVVLREKNVAFLRAQVKAARDRYAVGEITRTDVAQSESALARSEGQLTSARSQLATAVANYIKIIGHKPGNLVYPSIAKLPKTLDSALIEAGKINPSILSAAYTEQKSRYDVKTTFGDLLPEASFVASHTHTKNPNRQVNYSKSTTLKIQVQSTLYEGGYVYSKVRQAKHTADEDRLKVIVAVRSVREQVMSAWASYIAAVENITYTKTQVRASTMARDGVRQEYLVGARTTYDVLTAEADLITSQIALVNAESLRVTSAYEILSSVGTLTARDLSLPVHYYNPEENYHKVKYKFIGTNVNTIE